MEVEEADSRLTGSFSVWESVNLVWTIARLDKRGSFYNSIVDAVVKQCNGAIEELKSDKQAASSIVWSLKELGEAGC